MATQINQPLPGYPQPWGDKIHMVWDHYGPTSYVAYSASTGVGDIINASDLGFGGLEFVNHAIWNSYSNSGNYIVQAMLTKASDAPNGGAATRVTIQWFTVASGAFSAKSTEVTAATNLSAEYVRLEGSFV
jgi:hypothetical protein